MSGTEHKLRFTAQDAANVTVRSITDSLNEMSGSVLGLKNDFQGFGKQADLLARDIEDVTDGFDKWRNSIDAIGDSYRVFGRHARSVADAIDDIPDPTRRAALHTARLNKEANPTRLIRFNRALGNARAEASLFAAELGPIPGALGVLGGAAIAAHLAVFKLAKDAIGVWIENTPRAKKQADELSAAYKRLQITSVEQAQGQFDVSRAMRTATQLMDGYSDSVEEAGYWQQKHEEVGQRTLDYWRLINPALDNIIHGYDFFADAGDNVAASNDRVGEAASVAAYEITVAAGSARDLGSAFLDEVVARGKHAIATLQGIATSATWAGQAMQWFNSTQITITDSSFNKGFTGPLTKADSKKGKRGGGGGKGKGGPHTLDLMDEALEGVMDDDLEAMRVIGLMDDALSDADFDRHVKSVTPFFKAVAQGWEDIGEAVEDNDIDLLGWMDQVGDKAANVTVHFFEWSGAISSVIGGFAGLVQGMAAGTIASGNFAGAFGVMLGDLFQQVGAGMTLLGLSMAQIQSGIVSPATAIGLGAGLTLVGAALSGFSSRSANAQGNADTAVAEGFQAAHDQFMGERDRMQDQIFQVFIGSEPQERATVKASNSAAESRELALGTLGGLL